MGGRVTAASLDSGLKPRGADGDRRGVLGRHVSPLRWSCRGLGVPSRDGVGFPLHRSVHGGGSEPLRERPPLPTGLLGRHAYSTDAATAPKASGTCLGHGLLEPLGHSFEQPQYQQILISVSVSELANRSSGVRREAEESLVCGATNLPRGPLRCPK